MTITQSSATQAASIWGGGPPPPRRGFAIMSVLAAMTLVVLDAGMINVALPTLSHAFGSPAAQTVMTVTAYQTALVMALLPAAALGERLGNRLVFQVGVGAFVLASILCAVSPSLPWLIAARFLQGLGGSAVMALGVALLRQSVPHDQLGAAVGWNALAVALSAAAAPTIGALIVAQLNWSWLFLLSIPIGVAVLMASRQLPFVTKTSTRLDLAAIALNAAAFGLLVLSVQQAPHSLVIAGLLAVATVAAFIVLILREAPKRAPLFPLDLLRERSFSFSVIASVLCFTGQTAALVALPFYLQHGLGQTPLTVGLTLSPWPLAVAATSALAGRLSDRLPTAWLCAFGGGVFGVGLGMMAALSPTDSTYPIVALSALSGVGFGLFQVPNNRNLFSAAPADRSGAAGAMQGTARLTGQVSGALLMTLLFTAAPLIAAARIGLAIGAGFALAAGLVSILRPETRGA